MFAGEVLEEGFLGAVWGGVRWGLFEVGVHTSGCYTAEREWTGCAGGGISIISSPTASTASWTATCSSPRSRGRHYWDFKFRVQRLPFSGLTAY